MDFCNYLKKNNINLNGIKINKAGNEVTLTSQDGKPEIVLYGPAEPNRNYVPANIRGQNVYLTPQEAIQALVIATTAKDRFEKSK